MKLNIMAKKSNSSVNKLKVAAVQMVSVANVEENLKQAKALVNQAAEQGAKLVCLPEFFCYLGGAETDKLEIAEAFGEGYIQKQLAQWAKNLDIYLVGGTIPLKSPEPNRVYNTTLVYNPEGACIARYDKIHLFSLTGNKARFDEADTIYPGNFKPVVCPSPMGPIGLSVCYDLRFPELYRQMGAVNLIVVPSAFTYKTGQAHWEVLLRARAIENQAYVLAPAQGGTHEGRRRTWGHTLCVNAWGEVMKVLPSGPGLVCCELSMEHLTRVRERLPALSHRVL